MDWWKGTDQTRLLIAPDQSVNGSSEGCLVSLQHPKTGKKTCYLLNKGTLQELHWFKQSHASWFLGDYVCEDGALYIATPVDPVFILLPMFEEARMKKGNDLGKFRQLDEIIFVDGYPGYQHFLSIAETNMRIVCEIKEVGSLKFFRLDDSKVLAWLCCKVHQLVETLPSLGVNYAARDVKSTSTLLKPYLGTKSHLFADAITIIAEYLNDDPWLRLLCNHFKVNLLEAAGNLLDAEISPSNEKSNQGNGKTDDKSKKTSKQVKRTKVETHSRNIKDMFSRASGRG